MVFATWVSTCTATKFFYVLPANDTHTSCPSQPCVTLGDYLKNKGVTSSISESDVEFRFLPGEHHVTSNMKMWNVSNVSLVGLKVDNLMSVVLICKSQSFVAFLHSYNITVSNIIFNQCDGNIKHILFKEIWQFDQHKQDIIVSLFLFECYFCKIMNMKFFGYGLMGINVVGNSILNNVTIELETDKPTFENNICMYRIMLIYIARDYHSGSDTITMNKLSISGYSNNCHSVNLYPVIDVQLQQNQYNMLIKLSDSDFYNMDQTVLKFETAYNHNSNAAIIKNCTFKNLKYNSVFRYEPITAKVPCINTTIAFVDCDFLLNENVTNLISVAIVENDVDSSCAFPTNVILENCNFIGNIGGLLLMGSYDIKPTTCIPNLYMKRHVSMINTLISNVNEKYYIDVVYFHNIAVYMNGNINITENLAQQSIMGFQSCNVTFMGNITFLLNKCTQIISFHSWRFVNTYITVMEYTNVLFANNVCTSEVILLDQRKKFGNLYPLCLFQYGTTDKTTVVLPDYYSIRFTDNVMYSNKDKKNREDISEFLSHCKWLSTAAFHGFHAGAINQQIISINKQHWRHHKKICHCSQDGYSNCSIDSLGPIYPGQMLKLELCIPEAKETYNAYVETHAKSLPSSACKIANQAELTHSMGNTSKTVNFTIVSDSYKECELFLTAYPHVLSFFDAFLVQLLPCPVGFIFNNGICDCDPFLPSDITKCYIDSSTISRPANVWITIHTQTNSTTYLTSECPLDYCLPYSSNVNLLHPDLQCQFNRTGILCSQCQNHLSMVFGSSRCMKCTNLLIIPIIIIVTVAGIVVVALLYLLNLTVTIGTINGIIFYANIISINDSVFLVNDNVFKPLRVFITFLNLDLGIETCFYNGMDSYAKMWLQLFFPFYLMTIAISIIITSRYFSKILRLTYTRSLPVLATLLILSYTGVLRTVLTVLFSYSTITHLPSDHRQILWSFDASIPLFGLKFTILFITCLLLFLLLILFNITLSLSRFLSHPKINCFKSLLTTLHSSCKDKYFYWVAVHIMAKNLFLAFYIFKIKLRLVLSTIVLVFFTVYQGYNHPYKNTLINIQELLLLINITITYGVSYLDIINIFPIVTNMAISLIFIQFCAIVLYHFIIYTSCNSILRTIKVRLIKLFTRKKNTNTYAMPDAIT